MDDEIEDDELGDDHEWEYYQEAIQADLSKESIERLHRMPKICQECRWLDWYYTEECSYHLIPKNGQCLWRCHDYKFAYHLPSKLRLLWWDLQYRVWSFWHND